MMDPTAPSHGSNNEKISNRDKQTKFSSLFCCIFQGSVKRVFPAHTQNNIRSTYIYTHTHIYACTDTYTDTHMHTFKIYIKHPSYACIYTYSYIHTHLYASCMHTYIHYTYTDTHMHAMHAFVHTYMHTCKHSLYRYIYRCRKIVNAAGYSLRLTCYCCMYRDGKLLFLLLQEKNNGLNWLHRGIAVRCFSVRSGAAD